MKIVSVGELLWDLFPGAEHLGGAPFNFAAHAARLGHDVTLLTAVGADARGHRAVARLAELGLSDRFVQRIPDQPTGFVSVDICDGDQPGYRIHRPAAYDLVALDDSDYREISKWRPDWIYYGTLHQIDPRGRELTRQLTVRCPEAKRFYDVNLRSDSWTADLVMSLMQTADIVKLNELEACVIGRMLGAGGNSLERLCRKCAEMFRCQAVCVTRGAKGCVLLIAGEYVEADGYAVQVRDAVGAGDAFAAAFLHGLARGWLPDEIADFANRVGALVASREGAVPAWDCEESVALVRSRV